MLHERIEDFVNTGFSVFLFKQVHESGQQYADMAELADAPDLGSGPRGCRFKSCYPQLQVVFIY